VPDLLQELLAHPFVARQAPKSAGREEFGRAYYEPLLARYHSAHNSHDVMVTLVEATAQILHRTMVRDFGARLPFARLVLTGGGALNPRLRAAMAQAFAPLPVEVEQEGVLAPQNHEPAAMALIASRTMHGLPSALPQVTGAPYGSVLGHIYRPTPAHVRLPSAAVAQGEALLSRLRGPVAQAWQRTAQQMRAEGAATAISFALHQSGAQVLAFAEGEAQRFARVAEGSGEVQPAAHPAPATPQSLFDVASVTKTACTTACIMALVSDGRLALHAKASTFLPALRGTDKADITVQQLLSHRSGLSAWAPLYLLTPNPQQALEWIAQSPLSAAPGARRIYSDLGFMLLGAIIEAVTGEPLSAYFQGRIAQPLGLTRRDVRFGPVADPEGQSVATAHDNAHEQRMIQNSAWNPAFAEDLANVPNPWPRWRKHTLVGEVNDGNAHHLFGGTAAHAGLFATAEAISTLLASMTASGHRGGPKSKLFAQEVVHAFLLPAAGDDYLGWANPRTWQSLAPWRSTLAAHGCVIAEGFTGCMGFVVPSLGLTLSMLANRQHQPTSDPAAVPKLYPYWRQVIGALLEALNP